MTTISNLLGQGIKNEISVINFQGKIEDDFSVIKATQLFDELSEIKERDLEYKKLLDTLIYIENFGNSYIIALSLKNDYPECIPEYSYLIINEEKNRIAFFPFYSFSIYKPYKDKKILFVAGMYRIRQRFYFSVYEFFDDKFIKILDTKDEKYCNLGVHIASTSPEYLNYIPDLLKYSNKDINNDGVNDIIFSGKAKFVKGVHENNEYSLKTIGYDTVQIEFVSSLKNDKLSFDMKNKDVFCRLMNKQFKYDGSPLRAYYLYHFPKF